jgi:hypothetical protein
VRYPSRSSRRFTANSAAAVSDIPNELGRRFDPPDLQVTCCRHGSTVTNNPEFVFPHGSTVTNNPKFVSRHGPTVTNNPKFVFRYGWTVTNSPKFVFRHGSTVTNNPKFVFPDGSTVAKNDFDVHQGGSTVSDDGALILRGVAPSLASSRARSSLEEEHRIRRVTGG